MVKNWWAGKKVLVTGGAGFIGSHVVEEILRRAPTARVTVADQLSTGKLENLKAVAKKTRLLKADLRDEASCFKACRGQEVVVNLAARVAGVRYNSAHHAEMFRDNMLIACHMIEAARRAGAARFLAVSTACVYPREARVPTPESEGFRGEPEPTNAGYGWAKRMSEVLTHAYRKEHGLNTAIVRPYNAYGPRDHFESQDSHVIAALIRRVARGDNPLVVWGDGKATRAFLYVEDLARGLVDAAERAGPEPLNLGTGEEVSIRRLAETIVRLSGKKIKLVFDAKKPSGQPRRNCDAGKARRELGFKPKVGLEEGLKRTLDWYLRSH